MPTDRECQVLQIRPRQVICHGCVAQLAAALPAEGDPTFSARAGSYQHGAGTCSVCRRFSPIIVFSPLEEASKEWRGARRKGAAE